MDPLHSPVWHRVAELRPRIAPGLRFQRHRYRGELWYVVRNPATGRVHRLTPAAYSLLAWMDGKRSVQESWALAAERMGDAAPTRDEAARLLGILYTADVLRCDVTPDTTALLRLAEDEAGKERWARRNPIAFRVPLLDPDAFLGRWDAWVGPAFSRAGAIAWGAVVLAAVLTALQHRAELGAAASQTLLEPGGLFALWLVYPLVKALHELGHAFAVKRWGGEVHELGILFLVFLPLPYVDASAASVHPEKQRRIAVAAAGIAVELLLAALATFVWVAAEPGPVRQAAWALMLLGAVSSLLFNGNPLLRFDGYYVLCDALEIPNLAPRARRHVSALLRRYVLGQRIELPETAPGEAPWLVGYALASSAYAAVLLIGIALFLAERLPAVGVALALAILVSRIVLPFARHVAQIATDPVIGERRARALAGSVAALALGGLVAFALPLPLRTRSEGVIWLPERSQVRAGTGGFVEQVLATPHTAVGEGEPLIRIRDPSIEARVRVLDAERRELELRLQALEGESRVRAEIEQERLAEIQAELERATERAGQVTIRASAGGIFVPVAGDDLVGRHVRQGEVVAYVVDRATAIARVVVPQEDVALVRERGFAAWVRRASDVGPVLCARVVREVPAASDRLPTPVLGSAGGGRIRVDPLDPDGLRTLEPVFQFDLALPDDLPVRIFGERVHVRFDHGAEPVGYRAYRSLRRVFLSRLGV